MISKERAKELQAKFYLEGDLTDEEVEELSAFRLIFDMEELKEEMRNAPKYTEMMKEVDFYNGILRDKFTRRRDN